MRKRSYNRYKKSNKFNMLCICVFLIVILFISTFNLTTSRYLEQLSSTNDIIAVPVLTMEKKDTTFDTSNMIPRTNT